MKRAEDDITGDPLIPVHDPSGGTEMPTHCRSCGCRLSFRPRALGCFLVELSGIMRSGQAEAVYGSAAAPADRVEDTGAGLLGFCDRRCHRAAKERGSNGT